MTAARLFIAPPLSDHDEDVLADILRMRESLADHLRAPRRWLGGLRRHVLAQAIRGSNSIEGYHVTTDDAAAAVDDQEPLSADAAVFAEIRGYRQALGYALTAAADPAVAIEASTLSSMHYMMLGHEPAKWPGRYRPGPIYVQEEHSGTTVYEGPPADEVPELMAALVEGLAMPAASPFVEAAMAHLNLDMIHPFRDGNGRMARALQTLVLARSGMADPTFSSIEEWLGRNTDDYYRVLAHTGAGVWQPSRDAGLWVSFVLRAHHMQAQTLRSRITQAMAMWAAIDDLTLAAGLPDRTATALYEAALGYRVRRGTYVARVEVEDRTGSRDLKDLVDAGLLRGIGDRRGRHYVAGDGLAPVLAARRGARVEMVDPYPDMKERLAAPIRR